MTLPITTNGFYNKEYIENKETLELGNNKNAKRVRMSDAGGSPIIAQAYQISDEDLSGQVQYYGYVDSAQNWIVWKRDSSVSPITDRYVLGAGNYATNWGNRATSLVYDYWFNLVFP